MAYHTIYTNKESGKEFYVGKDIDHKSFVTPVDAPKKTIWDYPTCPYCKISKVPGEICLNCKRYFEFQQEQKEYTTKNK